MPLRTHSRPVPASSTLRWRQSCDSRGRAIPGRKTGQPHGKAGNPTLSFLDLDDEGNAETLAADVDPGVTECRVCKRPPQQLSSLGTTSGQIRRQQGRFRSNQGGWTRPCPRGHSPAPGTHRHNGQTYPAQPACRANASSAFATLSTPTPGHPGADKRERQPVIETRILCQHQGNLPHPFRSRALSTNARRRQQFPRRVLRRQSRPDDVTDSRDGQRRCTRRIWDLNDVRSAGLLHLEQRRACPARSLRSGAPGEPAAQPRHPGPYPLKLSPTGRHELLPAPGHRLS